MICTTRYGNVMASRGSVIPLFVDLIKSNKPITVTDPNMTRFMMTLDDAVDLVLYAFSNGVSGDIFVQKSPASTIETLTSALKDLFKAESVPVKIIGTRHGEKLYETLLSVEEMASSTDLGNYYKVSPDLRDLNYDKFFEEGDKKLSQMEEGYHSHNTERLDLEETKSLLLKLSSIAESI